MTAYEIEEKVDILYFLINSIQTNISYLDTISYNDSKYNLYVAQLNEMYDDLNADLIELQNELDKCSKEELQEAMTTRLIYDELSE